MIDSDYKAAIGKYPTGVTVISTIHRDKLFGFTANSFTSVSLNPPILSFCLSKKAGSLSSFQNSSNFVINILAFDQANIAKHFSSQIADKFSIISYNISSISNCPIIEGVVSFAECEKIHMFDIGDHFLFTGKVLSVQICNNKPPLIYFAKNYYKLNT